MPAALIIGASRGLGHELVRQYREDGWQVVATARAQEDCAHLEALGAKAIKLDVTNADAIAGLGWTLDGELFDAAWLVAGVYGPRHDGFPTQAEFDTVMHTNVLAAMRLLPIVAPLVAAAGGKVAVLSSTMASMGLRDNPTGSLYRASKAALNSVLVDASLRWGPKGATCVAMCPGWVQTDMGGPHAPLTPEDSVHGLRKVLAGLAATDNGRFLGVDGAPIPW
jgi:NAD(P)-dependent dehydrogenase (short-subunit alcohol dehydrogenase family)